MERLGCNWGTKVFYGKEGPLFRGSRESLLDNWILYVEMVEKGRSRLRESQMQSVQVRRERAKALEWLERRGRGLFKPVPDPRGSYSPQQGA